MKIKCLFSAVLECDSGATAVEYGLIVSLIVISIMVALNGFADEATEMWNHVASTVESSR